MPPLPHKCVWGGAGEGVKTPEGPSCLWTRTEGPKIKVFTFGGALPCVQGTESNWIPHSGMNLEKATCPLGAPGSEVSSRWNLQPPGGPEKSEVAAAKCAGRPP